MNERITTSRRRVAIQIVRCALVRIPITCIVHVSSFRWQTAGLGGITRSVNFAYAAMRTSVRF
jgi:hypothetical protein